MTLIYPAKIHLQERNLIATAKSEVTSRNYFTGYEFTDVLVSTRAPTYKRGGISREWNRIEGCGVGGGGGPTEA